MTKYEVEKFAEYEVYAHGEGWEAETICLCNSRKIARTIAKRLVMGAKEPNIRVYVRGVYYGGGEFVPGGGWYDVFWRDEDGSLRSSGIS